MDDDDDDDDDEEAEEEEESELELEEGEVNIATYRSYDLHPGPLPATHVLRRNKSDTEITF